MQVKLIHTVHWNGKVYRAGMTISLPDDMLEFIEDGSEPKDSEPFLKRIKTKSKESHYD